MQKVCLHALPFSHWCDNTHTQSDADQHEARRFQERCRNAIVNGKRDHGQLTQDGFRLQTLLKEGQEAVRRLQEELNRANMELKNVETYNTGEVELVEVCALTRDDGK